MIHGYYHHILRKVHAYLLFSWYTLWQLGKALNNQHGNFKQNIIQIIQDIKNQTKISYKKQGYIIGHLKSNEKLSSQHPQWSCHCERPWKRLAPKWCSQKWGEVSTPSLLRIICGVVIFFFFGYKKIRKKKKNTQGTYLNNTTSH